MRNEGDVEATQDRLLGLSIKQKPKRGIDAPFGGILAAAEPLPSLLGHRDLMSGLPVGFADRDRKTHRIAFARTFHRDHRLWISTHAFIARLGAIGPQV